MDNTNTITATMRRTVFSFGTIAMFVAWGWVSQIDAAEIRFKASAYPSGPAVLLSDVAEISPSNDALGAIRLFPAPIVGGKRIESTAHLRDVLSDHGVSSLKYDFTGAGQITILGPENPTVQAKNELRSQTVNSKITRKIETELLAELTHYLNRCTSDGNPENAIPWDITLKLDAEQIRRLSAGGLILGIYGGKNPLVGKQEFQTELEGIDATTGRRMLVRFIAEIALPPRVAVAKRSLARDLILNRHDIEFVYSRDVKGTDYYSDPAEVLGKAVRNNIREGTVLQASMLRSPILIRKGDAVTVYAKAPQILVKSTAKALEDGAMGDLIALEQLQKEKSQRNRNSVRNREETTFVARVCGAGTVEIFATADERVGSRELGVGSRESGVF